MQQDVDQVMTARILQAIQLTIQHVREPREGVPVGGMSLGEGPDESFEGDSTFDLRILVHVLVIIVVDEPMPSRLAEYQSNAKHKKNANAQYDVEIRGSRFRNGWALDSRCGARAAV